MSKTLRKCLEAKRDAAVHEAAERLLADANTDVWEIDSRIESYSKLLAVLKPPPSREWLWALVVAVICLTCAGLLWRVRMSNTRITLNLQSEAVELTLTAPWSWSGDLPLETRLVRLESLSAIEAALVGSMIESVKSEAWIAIENGNASLKRLSIERDGVMTIERANRSHVDFYARGAKLAGQLLMIGPVHLSAGNESTDASFDAPLDLEHHVANLGAKDRRHCEEVSVHLATLYHARSDLESAARMVRLALPRDKKNWDSGNTMDLEALAGILQEGGFDPDTFAEVRATLASKQ